jgi:DNA repair exonuclease SbcCD ATPase subunit
MPRLGLSYAAVKEAAERLEAQGHVPTVMRVRSEVGGTGSLSTIARHLKEWRQIHGAGGAVHPAAALAVATDAEAAPDPHGVPAEVGQIARSAWQRLTDLAAEQIAEVRAACQAEQERSQAAATQQVQAAEQRAQAAMAAAQREVERAQAAQASAQVQAEAERAERQEAAARASERSEQQAAHDSAQRERLEAAGRQNKELAQRLAHSELGRHKAEEARDMALERQRSSEAQCAARMDKAAHLEQQRLASMTQSFERLVASLRQDEAQAKADLAKHQQAVSALRERLSGRETLVAQLQQRVQAAKEAQAAEQDRCLRLQAEATDWRDRGRALTEQLAAQSAAQPAVQHSLRAVTEALRSMESRLSKRADAAD